MIFDYDVKEIQTFDRNKPYWSKHYGLILANIDLNITHYNIATRCSKDTRDVEVFLILHETEVKNSIPVRRHSNGKYKFYLGQYLPVKSEDYNVNLEYVESRDNPTCHIYKVSVV